MNRRTLLKNLGLIASGALILPSCDFSEDKVPIALNNLKVTVEQEELLALLVDTILPKSEEIPGAKDLGVQNFVWVMVDDCMPKKQQEIFINGLNQFGRYTEKFKETSFAKLKPEEKIPYLTEILEKKPTEAPVKQMKQDADKEELPPESYLGDIQYFLNTSKRYTVQGFLQSQYVMTELMPYALVPGSHSFCETIDPTKRVNIYG
ncbi:gluconate 2-dehydrogenase subunit 3 family protein [Chondrinema litorale]|uniref:gluconate 2-dehydrogenase subunit 3 family protein n=1 Tax=Chondrinema litorale TaxID=2994555 RepID=UPI00254343BD|nr:gluconate 2-dehydrogenase subunit 3 family protein [Chondrinema litorale]UZR98079.1 gluconate 2-dehydrogenase subunit 3 family protein [Chondrinema litorale]